MKNLVTIILFVFSVSLAFATEPESNSPVAKKSQIEGKITDSMTGEALVGVSVKVKGSDISTYSDLDGNFHIEGIAAGTYDIDIDYVSYKDLTLKEVSATSSDVKLKVELTSEI